MEKVKILCVGIGGYANTYLQELPFLEDPDFEFVGMIDVAPQSCMYYPKLVEMGVPLYESMEAFYAQNSADLAIITTPIHFHTQQILCALEHGSNVMCEKPMSGVSADEEIIRQAMEKSGKFVIIGYQWSYSKAILDLKQDISDGLYGKAQFLKSMVLWPRSKEYYNRGSGWGGKIRTPDGAIINDSVVSNATAHYIHNMLYVTGGAHGKSSEALDVTCTLLRANAIENFDTATAHFRLENGGEGLFVVSHATEHNRNPVFEYRFEKGTVTYSEEQKEIIGYFADGTEKHYGNPFENINRKIYDAIAACREESYVPPCGVPTAAPQVRFVETLQKNRIYDVRKELVQEEVTESSHRLYVAGLEELLKKCYEEEKILSQCVEFEGLVE